MIPSLTALGTIGCPLTFRMRGPRKGERPLFFPARPYGSFLSGSTSAVMRSAPVGVR
jgi:hypothetical protein